MRRTTLVCMSNEEKCDGEFPDHQLQKALPEHVFQKYQEASVREALKEVEGMEDMVTCHKCDFQAEVPPENKILTCPLCSAETCRECGLVSHIPLRCDEVEKENETDARRKIEEAMTNARIRECLKCNTRFFKTEGCNKVYFIFFILNQFPSNFFSTKLVFNIL